MVRLQDIAPIHEFCSQLVLHIFNEIDIDDLKLDTLNTLEIPYGDTFPSRSSTASPLSACYEILRADSDASASYSSTYSSFDYPSEPEPTLDYVDSYEVDYKIPDISTLQAAPFNAEAISTLADQREAYHVVPDLSWLETLVATDVDDKESERLESRQKEAKKRDSWSTDLEELREGIEQVIRYEPEQLDDSSLNPASQKLSSFIDSTSTVVGYTSVVNYDEEVKVSKSQ
ncbi:hypothetical protein COOONC_01583 [Cooperia oncophora]